MTDARAADIAGEMMRLTTDRNGWTATLLTPSSTGLIRELLTAGENVGNCLAESAFADVGRQVRDRLLTDPGLGSPVARGALADLLPRKSTEFTPRSRGYQGFQAVLPDLAERYFANWRVALTEDPVEAPERVGALLVADLRGRGLHPAYLTRWLEYRLSHEPRELGVADLLDDLETLCATGRGEAEVLVTVAKPVAVPVRDAAALMPAEAVRGWLEAAGFSAPPEGTTAHGGLVLRGPAWDLYGALADVDTAIRRISHRIALTSGAELDFHRLAYLRGVAQPRAIPTPQPVAHLLPAYRPPPPGLASAASDDRLEVAVEFLQAAAGAGGAAATGMLWAALESLLYAPGDQAKSSVADRAADVALIAWIRFDLQNSLGMTMSRRGDHLWTANAGAEGERLARFLEYLSVGDFSGVTAPTLRRHLAHTARLTDPERLRALHAEILDVLHGLYRQRNLVLHGGIHDGALLPGILAAAPALVAAVVNRYARASAGAALTPHAFAFAETLRLKRYWARPRDLLDLIA